MDPAIFKACDISGIYPDQLDEEDAWKIGHAAARFLPSLLRGYERGQPNAQSICVGRDMRPHSRSIAQSLIEGINAAKVNVIDVGMIDSPQMYFAINHLGTCGGVQVTGGHNPGKYNGFKISGLDAKPVGVDTGLKEIQHIATALLHTKGRLSGTVEKCDLTEPYGNHVLKFLKPNIRKLKVVVDASNGVAGKVLPAILTDVPIEIVPVNFEHKGVFKHEPNPLVEKNLRGLKTTAKRRKCDFGICFDGDAERLVVVDEKGVRVGCDLITALMAVYFLKKQPKSTIVHDLRSSMVVSEEIIKYGGTPRRERAGHTSMKKALRDTHAVFGGALSGHFYYRDNYYADSGMITLVHFLNIVSEAGVPVSELVEPLRRYYSSGEISFKLEDRRVRMEELTKRYSDGQIDQLDGVTIRYRDWWLNCRSSETEPLLRLSVEAKTEKLLQDKLGEVEQQLGKRV
ncbi:MAG: phosphomannomutase/phosphoglucomutase [Planctomycetota bacterium]|jgi:phosphomannomutase